MALPTRGRLLLVDDDVEVLELTATSLRGRGHAVHTVTTAEAALEASLAEDFDLVLTDLRLGADTNGLNLCRQLLAARPGLPILVLTGNATLGAAVAAMRAGAVDYLVKPIDPELLDIATTRALDHHRLAAEVVRLRDDVAVARGFEGILGTSEPIRRMLEVIDRVAATPASVLITGESGTGKELVARAIHSRSRRADGPFIALNCAALPHELLESELFGHSRGAFTDAKLARKGLFVESNGGSLFLDEIGEMPLRTQVKLLRALQERTVRPIGAVTEIPFDARLICATNRNLQDDVTAKRFREDLYYRINVVTIHVPPLRERPGDIRVLAETFLQRAARAMERDVKSIAPAAMGRLLARRWPGNVRELENVIDRAVSMAATDCLGTEDFAEELASHAPAAAASSGASTPGPIPIMPTRVEDLVTAAEQEERYLHHVLDMLGGNRSRAAEVLGYDRRTLHRKLRRTKNQPSREPGTPES